MQPSQQGERPQTQNVIPLESIKVLKGPWAQTWVLFSPPTVARSFGDLHQRHVFTRPLDAGSTRISLSSIGLTPGLQSHTPNCLTGVSLWISQA